MRDELLPFKKIENLLIAKFGGEFVDDALINEIQYCIDILLCKLGRENNLRKEEIDLLKINITFSNSGENILISPANLFTACLLFDKYIPSVFIPKDATEIAHRDGSIIRYNEEENKYEFKEYIKLENYNPLPEKESKILNKTFKRLISKTPTTLKKKDNKTKIKFVDEWKYREVELIGKVLCIRSNYDASWEFPINKEFNLYKQIIDNNKELFIVFNDNIDSHWYACFDNLENLSTKDFEFILL